MKHFIPCFLMFLMLGNLSAEKPKNIDYDPTKTLNNPCLTNPCVTVICPQDITIDCIENFTPLAVDATAMSICGTITAQWVTQPDQTGGPNCPFTTYVYTYKAVDDQGNIGCCERTITIMNADPTISVPPGFSVECFEDILIQEEDATVTTSCGEELEVTIYPPVINGVLDCPGTTYTWTYRVEDQCEREATADRIFTNDNNAAPEIIAPDDTTCECLAGINANPNNATVITACTLGASTVATYQGNNGPMDCPGTTYTYLYKATDDCGRMATDLQVFTIDNGPPVFDNCPENCLTLNCEDDYESIIQAWLSMVTARTSCGFPLEVTNDYDPNSQGVCFENGTVIISFFATDQCGRTSVCQGMVLVLDLQPPVFSTLPAGLTVECDGTVIFDDVTATDNCTDVVLSYEDEMVMDVCLGGEATRTWIAIDECGNVATTMQMVTVLPDTEAPLFTFIPVDYAIDCNGTIDFGDAIAVDHCSNVMLTFNDSNNGDLCNGGTATRNWTAEDDCGNISMASQTITILPDMEGPVFTFVPPDLTINCNDPVVFGNDAMASDDCSNVMLSMIDATTGDICNGQTATRTWTAEDDCGNTSQAVQTITILADMEAPEFTFIPLDLTINCNDPVVFGDPQASDDCSNVMLSMIDATTGDICNGQTATRTWTAEDDCENTAQAVQTITILGDMEDPGFTFIPLDLTINCNDPVVFGDAQVSDNCGNVMLSMIDATTGDICNGQTATRTWTAEDDCGNMAQAVQTITILADMEDPEFTFIPLDLTINCNDPVVFGDPEASDNCSNVMLSMIDATTGDICNGQTATRTWTAEDDCGNTAQAVQTITILADTLAPMFTLIPADMTINCADSIVFGDPQASDDCGNVMLSMIDATTGDICNGQTATRTWTAEDDCGNMAQAVQTITILADMEAPEFTFIPLDLTINCNDPVVFGDAQASDDCGNVMLSMIDATTGDICNGQTATRTWTAEDDCGNTAQAVQTITILADTLAPMFTLIPADMTINCADSIVFGDPQASDDCGNVMLSMIDATTGDICNGQTATRTWTAEDDCGNMAQAVQTITILADMEAPEFTFIPLDLTINCNDPVVFGDAQASDNCSNVMLSMIDATTGDICNGQTAIRTWTAEDDCGNTAQAVQTITILADMEAPEFTFIPLDLTINCNDPVVFGDAQASDDCGNVMLSMIDATTGDICNGQTATRTWTAEDDCGNMAQAVQTITILADMEDPEFTFIPLDLTINCNDPVVFGDAQASDNCSNVMFSMIDATTGDICNGQTATRTWTAEDDCGNTAQAVQTITILADMEDPEFTFIPLDLTINCNDPVVFGDPEASDNCSNVMFSMIDATTGDICNGQTATRTWTAEDDCGNMAQAVQTITILADMEAPEFTFIPLDLTINCNDPVVFGDAQASDNCSNVMLSMIDATTGDICNGQTATRTWTAEDDCGNTAQAVQTITILGDMEAPEFTFIPLDLTINCNDPVVFGDPQASDDCSNVMLSMIDATTGDICNGQTATRTWTAEDDCGNTAQAVQTITILGDMEAPEFTFIPLDLTINCNDPVVFGDAQASDDCGNVMLSMIDATTGDICNGQTATRTWTAEDDCGNTAQAVQTITILPDTTAPMFTLTPADMTINCADTVVFGDAQVIDDCGNVMLSMSDNTTGTLCSGRTAIRTWTAEDDCGNTAQAVQTITILPDTLAPGFTFIPPDMTINCDESIIYGDATAEDDCGVVTLTIGDNVTGDLCSGQTATRTWTAVDNCGNTSMAAQTITVLPDTLAPEFTFIPADTILACNESADFGIAIASDNCGNVMLDFEDAMMGDQCSGITATRTWRAEDDCGNISVAVQTIITLPDTDPPVFSEHTDDFSVACNDVIPNISFTVLDSCGIANVSVNIDTIGDFCTGGTVTRTWTATDTCGNSSMEFHIMTLLPDTIGPVLTCPDTLVRNIQSVGICERLGVLAPTATDNCTDNLVISYAIDFENNGSIDSIGTVINPLLFITYPIGTNIVTFTTEDECGHTDTCISVVVVKDLVPPGFFCNPVTVTLSVLDSMGNVTPGEFIFPPFLECCEDTILFELPDGTFTDSLFFDCDDTQFINGINVKVRAFDCFGNSSACDTKVFVVPPDEDPDFCNPAPPPFAFISGQVLTEDGNHMDSVYVELTGGMDAAAMTSNAGYYEFLSLPTNYDYGIEPFLNINPLNGVSTLDILLINQHILAIQSLDSPYKMIAADVNQSGSITVFDVLEMQQLILGTIPEFGDNTSWRFIDADFLFPANENPFSGTFPEACYVYDLYNGVSNVDFVGIKTGDVNGSASVNFQDNDSEDRGGGELVFTTPEQELIRNEMVSIPFRARDFKVILGFQFSFNFNTDNLEFAGIKAGKLITIEERNFGSHFLEDGVLTASWHSPFPYSILDGDVLFELEFLVKNDALLSDQVSISSFFTRAEAYQEGEPILDLLLEFTEKLVKPEAPLEFQNRPNPFKDETIISFHLSREIRGIFTLVDINRQVIRQERGMFPAGYNEFVIRGKDLPGYGIYYYQFQTAKHNIWRKMVFIDDL